MDTIRPPKPRRAPGLGSPHSGTVWPDGRAHSPVKKNPLFERPDGGHFGRLVSLYVGLALFGVSTALMVRSRLGLTAWSVLHEGLSRRTGLSIGLVTGLLGALVLLVWIPLRQRPGLGTISNVIVIGAATDCALALLPEINALPGRTALLFCGIALSGLATSVYISAGYGPRPRDGLTTGFSSAT